MAADSGRSMRVQARLGAVAVVLALVVAAPARAAFHPDPQLMAHARHVAEREGRYDTDDGEWGGSYAVLWCRRKTERRVTCLLREYGVKSVTLEPDGSLDDCRTESVYDMFVHVYRRTHGGWRAKFSPLPGPRDRELRGTGPGVTIDCG